MRVYLGDGVYAEIEGGMLKLTTEDGITVSNTIYLEPAVLAALEQYIEAVKAGIIARGETR